MLLKFSIFYLTFFKSIISLITRCVKIERLVKWFRKFGVICMARQKRDIPISSMEEETIGIQIEKMLIRVGITVFISIILGVVLYYLLKNYIL